MHTNFCKILTKIVIFQNYFRKLSFLNNKFVRSFIRTKINSILHISFAVAVVETLAGVATCGEGGGGMEVHMNLILPGVSKVTFSPYFGPSGRLLMEGIRAFQIPFFDTCNEKRHIQ
jgi:hypothetical protein